MTASLEVIDPEVAKLCRDEERRQFEKIRLIPSENYVSKAVLEASGTVFTNKYSEGYPHKRYYEGQQFVDRLEELCLRRACDLFDAEHANVQPYSGSPANLAVYLAFLKPGATVMGLALPMGGHLTHGWNVSVTGTYFRSVQYGVRKDTGFIDYDEVRDLARRERPQILWAGATAYSRLWDFEIMADIARGIGAHFAADIAHIAGLIAGGVHPSPIPHADVVTSTTHKTLRGPRGGFILSRAQHARAVDKQVFPGTQGGPLEHVVAAKAVAFGEALRADFKEYAAQVVRNARALAEGLMDRGYRLVSGGTDSHLILMDLRESDLTGRDAEEALGRAGIHVNKNTVPGETRSPFVTSGIRLGTPAVTTRGMGFDEMRRIADLIDRVLRNRDAETIETVGAQVRELAAAFPLYRPAESAAR